MQLSERQLLPVVAAVLLSIVVLTHSPAHAESCNFPPVKQQIDNVLDKDPAKGATFRKEVSEGADSITMVEKLVAPDMADKIDICRFEAAEYLTKRGFPPFH
jgi:hypothetical protein